jgi:7-carboxy-7-deazaguanine synthase
MNINIHEIFQSVDGEVNLWGQGRQTVFIRLQGCNLRCDYCDTKKTWDSRDGVLKDTKELAQEIYENFPCRNLTITGGEPLCQEPELAELLIELGKLNPDYLYNTVMETNGTLYIDDYLRKYIKSLVVDVKPNRVNYPSIYLPLEDTDWVKVIVADEGSYRTGVQFIKDLRKDGLKANVAFSPIRSTVRPKELLQWLQKDKLWDVTLNVQLHKLIGVY